MPFFFLNPVLAAIFQGAGIGLVLNILLNFTLIFGMGLGVFGAALSTSLAQIIMSVLYVVEMKKSNQSFLKPTFRNGISFSKMKEIVLIGLPYGIQETAFTVISIMIGRLVAVFGNSQIAAQKVGSQLEAISWESASGFSAALTAFVGQNYSSNKRERILKGYRLFRERSIQYFLCGRCRIIGCWSGIFENIEFIASVDVFGDYYSRIV